MATRKNSNLALQDTSTGELSYKVMKGLNILRHYKRVLFQLRDVTLYLTVRN